MPIVPYFEEVFGTRYLLLTQKASSLVEASNVDKKPDEVKLRKILEKEKDTKEETSK